MKLSELNPIKVSLSRLLEAPGIPAKVAYRAAKFSKKIVAEIKELEEARIALVKKYGKADADGNLQVPPDTMDEFNAAFDEVLAEEFELPVQKFNVADVERSGLTLLDFANLEFLFEDTPTKE